MKSRQKLSSSKHGNKREDIRENQAHIAHPAGPVAGLHVRTSAYRRLRGFKKTADSQSDSPRVAWPARSTWWPWMREPPDFIPQRLTMPWRAAGQASDGNGGTSETTTPLVMDRAYEDDQTRRTAWSLRFSPVVPPKSNRVNPWEHDVALTGGATRSRGCSALYNAKA